MQYLPINMRRFYFDVLIAGCLVILAILGYATGKAQVIAQNLVESNTALAGEIEAR